MQKYGVQLALYQHAVAQRYGDISVRAHYIREEETIILNRSYLDDALEREQQAVSQTSSYSCREKA